MPSWLKNPWWGLLLLVIGWWAVFFAYPGFYQIPFVTAILFASLTLLAFVMYYIYKDMSYCKYICPIGSLTKAYHHISFTWLGSYKENCSECKTFDCAKACPYNLKPFTFNNKNSMGDCSLCMECSSACDAISFKMVKPSKSLLSKFKFDKIEVWSYILITASITISMSLHHGLGRGKMAEFMPWTKTAEYLKGFINFGSADVAGLFVFIYSIAITLFFVYVGMFVASKALNAEFKKTFYTLGYAFAPIFIIGGLSHVYHVFFTHTYANIANGFIYGFGLNVDKVANLASRGDAWLGVFDALNYIAAFWAFYILYKRLSLFKAGKIAKTIAFVFASLLIVFYLSLNLFKLYAMYAFGNKGGGHSHNHGSHGNAKMFQSVASDKAILLQQGENKESGAVCGMTLHKFYKTNYCASVDGKVKQYCSIHCLVEDLFIKKLPLEDIKVVDVTSLKFIDAQKAFYVVGSSQKGTMSHVSKYAFLIKEDAISFAEEHGGDIVDYQEALKIAKKDFK